MSCRPRLEGPTRPGMTMQLHPSPSRDGMDRRDWLSLIAVHSDSWLISMAYFNAARLDAEGRSAGGRGCSRGWLSPERALWKPLASLGGMGRLPADTLLTPWGMQP